MEPQAVNQVRPVNIDTELQESYLEYAMSVIIGRALPDVRDGLKPVHRRSIYAMRDLSNYHNKPYLKSARIVGDVIGKYHPHGDTAVYDTIVRMAQNFSMRYPLVDGQGNFGSIDGDSAAAMRYTEIRMKKIAEEMIQDIDKDTVDFQPNYDGKMEEPTVLPTRIPNLLINGSSGIAVGMATNIPPHNLSEVLKGCLAILEDENISIDDLIKIIPGPDFPTAGEIYNRSGIISAYKTGRGTIQIRAVTQIETNKNGKEFIIISELPYQVNKARLIEKIADLIREKQVEGISDLRDESSREGMRVLIELKKGTNSQIILNQLYKMTQMQVSFGMILLAIEDKQPKLFNLKGMLSSFLGHRREVIKRRTLFDLNKAREKAHLLEGLTIALDHIDAVIELIKKSENPSAAKAGLISNYGLTEVQAQAILEMRLQRLTSMETSKVKDELAELKKQMEYYLLILGSDAEVKKIITAEINEILKNYGDERFSKIIQDMDVIEDEDLIENEPTIVTVTQTGYIKRDLPSNYKAQARGGKGTKSIRTKEDDYVENVYYTTTHSFMLCFTNQGNLFGFKAYRIPEGSKNSKGLPIVNLVNLAEGEKITTLLPLEKFEEGKFIFFCTKNGVVKKCALTDFSRPRSNGLIAITLDENDQVIAAKLTNGSEHIFITTAEGQSIRFEEGDVRHTGRTARGVIGIRLAEKDEVVSMEIISNDNPMIIITENGYGKRSEIADFRAQGRGGMGVITIKTDGRNGRVVGVKQQLNEDLEDVLIMTTSGQVIRTPVSGISVQGRNTMGVRLINVVENEKVVSFTKVEKETDKE